MSSTPELSSDNLSSVSSSLLPSGEVTWSRPAQLMAVVNATPDSFSDGGQLPTSHSGLRDHLAGLVAAGAQWLDVGAESSRPGSQPISAAQEWARLEPVLDAATGLDVLVSVDTYKGEVARLALARGVDMINDITAGSDATLLAAVAEAQAGLCLMHMQGAPATMQQQPQYQDVVSEVRAFFSQVISRAQAAGVATDRLLLDPGIGFGKTLAHNLALLRALPELHRHFGRPLLVGVSRKRLIAELLGDLDAGVPAHRDLASHCLHAQLAQHCDLLRVHDVAGAAQARRLGLSMIEETLPMKDVSAAC